MKKLSNEKGYILLESIIGLSIVFMAIFVYSNLILQCVQQMNQTKKSLVQERQLYEDSVFSLQQARIKYELKEPTNEIETTKQWRDDND